MPDSKLYTVASALAKAADIQTALAVSVVRFFADTLVVTENTTRTQLLAAEIASDGYTPGGYTLTAWGDPLKSAEGGAVITSPLVQIAYGPAGDPIATAAVGGYWIEDATDNVRLVAQYDPPRALAVVGDGWEWVEQIVEGRN